MTKKKTPSKKDNSISYKDYDTDVNLALYDGLLGCYSELFKMLSVYGNDKAIELSPAIRHVLANKDNMGASRFTKDLEHAHKALGTYESTSENSKTKAKPKQKKDTQENRKQKIDKIINLLATTNKDILKGNSTPLAFLNKSEIFNRLVTIVVDNLGLANDPTYQDSFEDLGADSLDWVELVMAVEEELNFEITDEVSDMLPNLKLTFREVTDVLDAVKHR